MRTQDLVARLASDLSPVERDAVPKRLDRALTVGLAGDAILLAVFYGLGSEMPEQLLTAMFWIRLAFPLMILIAALNLAQRLARPGASLRFAWFAAIVPVVTMLSVAAAILLATPPEYRLQLLNGASWWSTAASVVVLSLPSLAAVMYAMKTLAPTRLVLAGAGAGLLAGAQGLLVHALYCSDVPGQFWSVWHVLAIVITTGMGAGLAPACLRW